MCCLLLVVDRRSLFVVYCLLAVVCARSAYLFVVCWFDVDVVACGLLIVVALAVRGLLYVVWRSLLVVVMVCCWLVVFCVVVRCACLLSSCIIRSLWLVV